MNILEYKINADNLSSLIYKAEKQGLTDKVIAMNEITLSYLRFESYKSKDPLFKFIGNPSDKHQYEYCGIPISIDQNLEVGKVKIYGYRETLCDVKICKKNGSILLQNNVPRQIITCIE